MSEYDLKKSESAIGQLYPILEAKDGEVIDGIHRGKADKNWKRLRLEHIDTKEKKLVARLVANFHRRQVTREEKEEWINGLARIYKKQGLKVGIIGYPNEIKQKIMRATGLSKYVVEEYILDEFKQSPRGGRSEKKPRIPASQRIEAQLGKDYVERYRQEVIEEEKPKIEQQTKAKLLKDIDFQRQVLREIQKPKIVKPSEPCASGVCALPNVIEGKPPVDVVAERLEQFWKNNPRCMCKKCKHYGECGVIR